MFLLMEFVEMREPRWIFFARLAHIVGRVQNECVLRDPQEPM